jgi:hypothetical protein
MGRRLWHFGYAFAVIGDGDDSVWGPHRDPNMQISGMGHRLNRIEEQVREDLEDFASLHRRQCRVRRSRLNANSLL